MRKWFLGSEIIELERTPNSLGAISQKAKRENWLSRKSGVGKSFEYHISSLSEDMVRQLQSIHGFTDEELEQARWDSAGDTSQKSEPNYKIYQAIEDEIGTPAEIIAQWDLEGTLELNIQRAKVKKAKQGEASANFNSPAPINGQNVSLDFYDIDVSAGNGMLALQENKADPITFDKDFLINSLEVLPDDVFLMPVRGDSMLPTLKNQAIIMVKKIDIFAMDGIYVFRYNGQLMVKRLQFSKTGLTVVSDNPTYKTWELTPEEAETEDFEILGEVIWSGQRI